MRAQGHDLDDEGPGLTLVMQPDRLAPDDLPLFCRGQQRIEHGRKPVTRHFKDVETRLARRIEQKGLVSPRNWKCHLEALIDYDVWVRVAGRDQAVGFTLDDLDGERPAAGSPTVAGKASISDCAEEKR